MNNFVVLHGSEGKSISLEEEGVSSQSGNPKADVSCTVYTFDR